MAVLLSGCTATALDASDVVGKTLAEVTAAVPHDAEFLIQDASPRIGEAASFSQDQPGKSWTVVASCADAESIPDAKSVEVAVIPTKKFDADAAASGKLDDAVSCDGRGYR